MPKAIICVGCSASGKSTFAENLQEQGWVKLERDSVRRDILARKGFDVYSTNMWKHWKFQWEDEVTAEIDSYIQFFAPKQPDIVVSDTNLDKNKRKALADKFTALGYDVEIEVFGKDLSLDELWKRDKHRLHTVGHDVLARQYAQFRKEFPRFPKPNMTGGRAVIFDIDGTLANMGDRQPYDWDKVDVDTHNLELFLALTGFYHNGYEILILSGRDESCRELTEKWIKSFVSVWVTDFQKVKYRLYMRPEGDMRKDSIIKMELFNTYINGKYDVKAVFDDRPSVIRNCWMELGLRTYWCGEDGPYIEF